MLFGLQLNGLLSMCMIRAGGYQGNKQQEDENQCRVGVLGLPLSEKRKERGTRYHFHFVSWFFLKKKEKERYTESWLTKLDVIVYPISDLPWGLTKSRRK